MENFNNKNYKIAWQVIFSLYTFHGLIALVQFIVLSYTGFSYKYLPVYLVLALWLSLNVYLIFCSLSDNSLWISLINIFENIKARDVILMTSIFFLIVLGGIGYLRNLSGQASFVHFSGYVDILMPLFNLIIYAAVEMIVFIFYINVGYMQFKKSLPTNFARMFFIVLAVLSLLVLIVHFSSLGILPNYKGDWSRGLPAVPLLEWQILLACLLGVVTIYFDVSRSKVYETHLNLFLFILIWLGTSILWLSQPVIPNASVLPPHQPNFEIYPFIDSQTYDKEAQSILIGSGFSGNGIPQRPLYIVFLTIIHTLVGQDYHQMIAAQSLVFALFPALLFLLGTELFGRPLGVSLALLAGLRDYTSNLVSPFTGNLSYSKLFLSEIPIAMLLVLLLLVGIRWIKSNYSVFFGFLLGGILGVAMLIRTQSIVVLPVLILVGIILTSRKNNALIKNIPIVMISIALVVSPWLWRNWKITGDFIFDNPESQTGNLALRYSRLNGIELDAPRFPGETSSEFASRLLGIARNAIVENPWGAAWAASNSFFNHGVNNILLFPLRNEIQSLNDLWIPSTAFWEEWEGTPTPFQVVLLITYMFLFGLGISVAWYRSGWFGLLPIGFNLAYNFWTSIALLSGQRFMLAMDWSVYLYYMLGLLSILSGFLFTMNGSRPVIVDWIKNNSFLMITPVPKLKWPSYLAAGLIFSGIGLSLPLSEKIFQNIYPALSQEKVFANLLKSPYLDHLSANVLCMEKIVSRFDLQVLQGMALYPRYYQAGDGESFTDSVGYRRVDYGRLVFEMIGQTNPRIIFPMSQSPDFFPHASDVTLVYSIDGDLWFVLVQHGEIERLYISDGFDETLCQ